MAVTTDDGSPLLALAKSHIDEYRTADPRASGNHIGGSLGLCVDFG
jgi:hypothetical protein